MKINIVNNDNINLPVDVTILTHWVLYVLSNRGHHAYLTLNICICNEKDMTAFNLKYRSINKATDILSFEADNSFFSSEGYHLGDLIIAPTIILKEAKKTSKNLENHWCHIIIHGVLHLLGYDHIKQQDAYVMENIEIDILKSFFIENPYS